MIFLRINNNNNNNKLLICIEIEQMLMTKNQKRRTLKNPFINHLNNKRLKPKDSGRKEDQENWTFGERMIMEETKNNRMFFQI